MASEVEVAKNIQNSSPELAAYYADEKTRWRNMGLIMAANSSWQMVDRVITSLMLFIMSQAGVSNTTFGNIGTANLWLVSIMVMYFSWRSDHTVSRLGRRIPYFLFSAFFLICVNLLFPLSHIFPPWLNIPMPWVNSHILQWLNGPAEWVNAHFSRIHIATPVGFWFQTSTVMIVFYCILLFFQNIKGSTYSLLPIDMFPRKDLAKFNSVFDIVGGVVGFIALYWGFDIGRKPGTEWIPFVIAAGIMLAGCGIALFMKEPPIKDPTTERWWPWTALAVGWRDRRMIVLMVGESLLGGLRYIYASWLMLFAKNQLGLDQSCIGKAIAPAMIFAVILPYPIGWFIDRFGGMRIVCMSYFMQIVTFLAMMNAHDKKTLLITAACSVISWPFAQGGGMMIVKRSDPKEVGSVTSSLAFVRNLLMGIMIGISGWLIDYYGKNYKVAFILGICVSTVGFSLFFVYNWIMSRTQKPAAVPVAGAEPAGSE